MSKGLLLLLAAMNTRAVDLRSVVSASRLSNLPSEAHAGVRLNSDGTIDRTAATNLNWGFDDGIWLLVGAASDYEVQYTKNSGSDPDAGTLTTWQGLGTTRGLSMQQVGIGAKGGNFTVKVRLASSGAILATNTFSLNATVN